MIRRLLVPSSLLQGEGGIRKFKPFSRHLALNGAPAGNPTLIDRIAL
jgi:hypothetical protein